MVCQFLQVCSRCCSVRALFEERSDTKGYRSRSIVDLFGTAILIPYHILFPLNFLPNVVVIVLIAYVVSRKVIYKVKQKLLSGNIKDCFSPTEWWRIRREEILKRASVS